MSNSFQSEIPKARVNIPLNLNTGGAQKIARQIPQLKAMLALRNLLRDLRVNLLDNATFSKQLLAFFRVQLFAVPHFLVEGMDANLSLVSQMPKAKAKA